MSETSSCMSFIPFIESNNWVTFPLWRDKWFDPLPDFVCFFHTVNNAAIAVTNICHQLLSANPFTAWTIKITLNPRQPICYQLLSVNPFTSWTIKITFNPRQSNMSSNSKQDTDICHQFVFTVTFKQKTFRHLSSVSVYNHI